MHDYANLVFCRSFLEQETLLTLLQYSQLYIGDLVSFGEAAHPAVTSMGTWCLLGMTQVPKWSTGIPVLVCWVAVAVFCTAAVGLLDCR